MVYIKTYKDLIVWQKAIELVTEIYKLTDTFPKSELYGIISQMRRAAISIPSNIAEGYGRKSSKEYLQFFAIAYGSSLELETQIIISKNLHLAGDIDYRRVDMFLEEIQRMLHAMMYKMKEKQLSAKH